MRAGVKRIGLVIAVVACACSRHESKPSSGSPPAEQGSVSGGAAGRDVRPRFSRPIAATRMGDGSTVVAGLAVPTSSIIATRVLADGTIAWSKSVLDGVAWTTGADLRALPAPQGAAIVWRGQRAGKNVTQMVRVGAGGDARGTAVDVGPAACATDDALAWLEHGTHGTTKVRALAWSSSVAADVLTLAADRDPELVCGAHRLFALGGGEDDVTVTVAQGLDAGPAAPIIRDRDFASDEEREHDAYTVGDSLGIVRMGDSGALAIREVVSGPPSAWRSLGTKISPDDDIVAVDADARSVVVVFTHEQGDACAGASALAVKAVRASRVAADGSPEAVIELAPPVCDRDPGPFWTGALEGSFVVAWAERGHRPRKTEPEAGGGLGAAPVTGLAYRTLPNDPAGAAPSSVQRVEMAADDLVSAGCDKAHCYAVALDRPAGSDGMQPETARVVAFP